MKTRKIAAVVLCVLSVVAIICFRLISAPLTGAVTAAELGSALGALSLLPTVLSNLTLVLAIKHIGSTMTSILGSMEPLTAVLVGVVHFGEGFDLDSAAGLILVVTAVIIVILQTNHTPRTPPANIPPTQPQE